MSWECARCHHPQATPQVANGRQKYCEPCKVLAKRAQTRAYQRAHLADHRSYRNWRRKETA